jgi:hypothetical protein
MRRLGVALAVLALVLTGSVALAGVTYSGPGFVPLAGPPVQVVYHYWPTAPVYAAPVIVAPAYPMAVPIPSYHYPAPAVIRTKVYYGAPIPMRVWTTVP